MQMNSRKSRVPTTRLGRLVRIGFTAGEMAVGGMTEGVKRLTGITPEDAVNVFLTAANAQKLAKRLAGMRGAAMKMGPILSMDTGDLLPRELADILARLLLTIRKPSTKRRLLLNMQCRTICANSSCTRTLYRFLRASR